MSIVETRALLKTIVEGAHKTVEVMDRKFEQFVAHQAKVTLKTTFNDKGGIELPKEQSQEKHTFLADSIESVTESESRTQR